MRGDSLLYHKHKVFDGIVDTPQLSAKGEAVAALRLLYHKRKALRGIWQHRRFRPQGGSRLRRKNTIIAALQLL